MVLCSKLAEIVKKYPDNIAVQIKEDGAYRKYSYQEFLAIARDIGKLLVNLGVKQGERIAISVENRPEWGFIYFGIMFANAVAVPFDPCAGSLDVKYFVTDSSAKIAFIDSNLLPLFFGLLPEVSCLENIVVLEKLPVCKEKGLSGAVLKTGDLRLQKHIPEVLFSDLLRCLQGELPAPDLFPDALAAIVYTSGTTSLPKGVMLLQRNFLSNVHSIDELGIVSQSDNVLTILPLYHTFAFMVSLLIPLFSASTITYILSLKKEEILRCMRETNVTVLPAVPQLLAMFSKGIAEKMRAIPFFTRHILNMLIAIFCLVRNIFGINLNKFVLAKLHNAFGKKFRFFACGGAKLDTKTALFLHNLGFTILEGYGLTETAPIVALNSLENPRIGSVGKALPLVEIKIVNQNKKSIGEIAIKGGNVMQGYYNNQHGTAEVMRDGWFYSGDIGYIDKKGYLYIVGREKELIVLSSGKNISPEELEAHYTQALCVQELCILAIGQNEGIEEKLMAVVVPNFDYCRKEKIVNIFETIRNDLTALGLQYPAYKRIKGFVIASGELPRTRLGKLQRFAVKEKYLAELKGMKSKKSDVNRPVSAQEKEIICSSVYQKITRVLSNHLSLDRQINLADNLDIDLGLDSLGRVEQISALEKEFEMKISDSIMDNVFTVKDLFFEIEKLVLSKEFAKDNRNLFKQESGLWENIFERSLDADEQKRINLSNQIFLRVCTNFVCNIWLLIFKIFWRFKIKGIKNLPFNEPVIFCANHSSFLDGFLIASALPGWMRINTFFLGFKKYFKGQIIRYLVKFMRIALVEPGAQLVESLRICAYVLRNGKTICVFPEGTRSPDGQVKEFKKGVGILSKELKIRIVPVYINGTFRAWPRTKRFPKFCPLEIIFGKPCNAEELKNIGMSLGVDNDYAAIARGLREKVLELKNNNIGTINYTQA
ncbi:MAG: hypothetical protein DRP78_05475 [Candidatus Omnitrophota bacterium]|nr:MAG: hypothetical protein DRP78_05475 [Candidatus Omnitrophota bacterium]